MEAENMFFDIVGNAPEDILGEIFSHLTEVDDLRYLISWQIVSRKWRAILHDHSTKIYHPLFLSSIGLRELLPPPHYNTSDSFTYSSFRRAIKTHVVIKKGMLKEMPEEYRCGKEGAVKINAGPILADGFLVWLEVVKHCMQSSDREVSLKVVDLIGGTVKGIGKSEVREFGGLGKNFKTEDLHVFDIENKAALGCGGGVVAYWVIWDREISVRGLHKSSALDWKIPLSSLKHAGGNAAKVTELTCSKDYVIVRLSGSAAYQVFSIAKREIIHLLHVGLAPPGFQQLNQIPSYDENHFSKTKGIAKCAARIQDGYFIHTQITAVTVGSEHENRFRFLSWNLTAPQSYANLQYITVGDYVSDEDYQRRILAAKSKANPDTENELQPSGSGGIVEKKSSKPKSQTCFFLTPSFCSNATISTPSGNTYMRHYFYSVFGAQLLFEPGGKLQLYCHNSNHFTHPLRRWSYGSPPTSLRLERISFCEDYPLTPNAPLYQNYQKAAHWATFAAQDRRYEFVKALGEPLSSQYSFGGKRDRVRLRMSPLFCDPHYKANSKNTNANTEDAKRQSKKWDVDIKVVHSQSAIISPYHHSVGIWAGWEGVVMHWRDRILVWRWDLSYGGELGRDGAIKTDDDKEQRVSKGKGKRFWGRVEGT